MRLIHSRTPVFAILLAIVAVYAAGAIPATHWLSFSTNSDAPTATWYVRVASDNGASATDYKTQINELPLAATQITSGTLPVARGGTGITAFGSNVATWLGTPSSANTASAVTDETGTGLLVFGTSPTLLGTPIFSNGATSAGTLQINEDSDDGSNKVTITVPALAADVAYTLPADDGDAGEQLQTNGSGVLTWEAAGSGGGLTKFTEAESTSAPNNIVYVDSLTAAAASTNADVAIIPKGSGALLAAIPDSTATGGNKRGTYAVDWQMVRSTNAQVASGSYSTIGGGNINTASGGSSTVGGGYSNTASGNYSSISGGYNNTTSSSSSIIGGGVSNTASGSYSIIGGGVSNTASGGSSTVGGGDSNTASANYSTVSGGYYGKADKHGQQSYSSGPFATGGDAQRSTLLARNVTTDDTTSELFLNGSSNRCTIATDTTWTFSITIVARCTDADNESFGAKHEGVIDNNAGTVALVGTVTETILGDDSTGTWTVTVDADNTNDALRIQATGEAAKTIRWVARIELTEVSG